MHKYACEVMSLGLLYFEYMPLEKIMNYMSTQVLEVFAATF